MNEISEWLEAVEASHRGEQIDPLIEKILVAILAWHGEGKSPGWIARELEAGTLFQVKISRQTVKAIIAHNEALSA